MNINEAIIRIQRGKNISCAPMGDGHLFYKIIVDGQTIIENLSRQQAESIIGQAKNRLIVDSKCQSVL